MSAFGSKPDTAHCVLKRLLVTQTRRLTKGMLTGVITQVQKDHDCKLSVSIDGFRIISKGAMPYSFGSQRIVAFGSS
jgi:hypothetical protein